MMMKIRVSFDIIGPIPDGKEKNGAVEESPHFAHVDTWDENWRSAEYPYKNEG